MLDQDLQIIAPAKVGSNLEQRFHMNYVASSNYTTQILTLRDSPLLTESPTGFMKMGMSTSFNPEKVIYAICKQQITLEHYTASYSLV